MLSDHNDINEAFSCRFINKFKNDIVVLKLSERLIYSCETKGLTDSKFPFKGRTECKYSLTGIQKILCFDEYKIEYHFNLANIYDTLLSRWILAARNPD